MTFIISRSTLKPSLVKHFKWLLVHNEIHSIRSPLKPHLVKYFKWLLKVFQGQIDI